MVAGVLGTPRMTERIVANTESTWLSIMWRVALSERALNLKHILEKLRMQEGSKKITSNFQRTMCKL